MNLLYSTVNSIRDRCTPVAHKSTFRETGHITPEEFVGRRYIVFKFPSWSWAHADLPRKRVSFLPAGKQYLVSRHMPCQRRLDNDFAGDVGHEEAVVEGGEGPSMDDEDGWLRTGGLSSSQPLKVKEVRRVDDAGNVDPRADLELWKRKTSLTWKTRTMTRPSSGTQQRPKIPEVLNIQSKRHSFALIFPLHSGR